MKTYTYYFVDGTTNTIEVSDEWHDILTAMDKQEENNNRQNTRRHVSLDCMNTFGMDVEAKGNDPLEMLIRREDKDKLDAALAQLLPSQRELIEKVFFGDIKKTDIAEAEGVSPSAISRRLLKIYGKLKKLLS